MKNNIDDMLECTKFVITVICYHAQVFQPLGKSICKLTSSWHARGRLDRKPRHYQNAWKCAVLVKLDRDFNLFSCNC